MRIVAAGISARFDPSLGILTGFEVGGHAPLHTAPWVGAEEMPADAPPHLAKLGGDFFCAPFGGFEDGSPLHGWPPNAPWDARAEGNGLTATLTRKVHGATLRKELTVRDYHPFVYQSHIFEGGAGEVAVANHANVSLPEGGHIRTSHKRWWETPPDPLEGDPARGRSTLRYPAKGPMTRFPGQEALVDLSQFPWGPAHEDFACGVEAPGTSLGWTAVTRTGQGDVFLSLRNTKALPMTMLWHSHGGRDYPPWSGRHRHCLGVEEGAARHMLGVSTDADLSGPGALRLGGVARVHHAIGVLPWPSEVPIAEVVFENGALTVRDEDGTRATLPFDGAFLAL